VDDIALTVSKSLKDKIIKGEYVDIGALLSSSVQDKQNISVIEGELIVQTERQTNKLLSIEAWSDAFIIFMSIYGSAHPNSFQQLLKYMKSVRLGAKRSGLG